jgi:hypothetical protein
MATGNLDQGLLAGELLRGLFVGLDWNNGDPSVLFTDPDGPRVDAWVRLVDINTGGPSGRGPGAQVSWGGGGDGARSNTNVVTLVAPATAPTHVEFYSFRETTGEIETLAMTPISGVGPGATVVFNPGSISFRWGRSRPEDGDQPDHSTSDLREAKLASKTLKPGGEQAVSYLALAAIYKKFQHFWVVLDNGNGVKIASADNVGNVTISVEGGIAVAKNENSISIPNSTGSTFVAHYVEVWVHGSDSNSSQLAFDPGRSNQIMALRKQLSSPITVAAGQAVNIPAGAFKVRAS